MLLLHLLLQNWLNTQKKGKTLNDMQGNVKLLGQAIVVSLLYLSFQRWKLEGRIVIVFIKSVYLLLL